MLDYLRGRVERIEGSTIVVAVNGLGVSVRVADPEAFSTMVGKEARIFTALDIQPRRWTVYGFRNPEERREFTELWRIPGIGPGTAMKLLPHVDRIRSEGPAGIPDIPGIGQAKRSRLLKWLKAEDRATGEDAARELATALVALGLAPESARARAATTSAKHPGATLEKLVRLAVRRR
jgi:Holliday junction DNA helicase RuvA